MQIVRRMIRHPTEGAFADIAKDALKVVVGRAPPEPICNKWWNMKKWVLEKCLRYVICHPSVFLFKSNNIISTCATTTSTSVQLLWTSTVFYHRFVHGYLDHFPSMSPYSNASCPNICPRPPPRDCRWMPRELEKGTTREREDLRKEDWRAKEDLLWITVSDWNWLCQIWKGSRWVHFLIFWWLLLSQCIQPNDHDANLSWTAETLHFIYGFQIWTGNSKKSWPNPLR